jgi:hypothetical protein
MKKHLRAMLVIAVVAVLFCVCGCQSKEDGTVTAQEKKANKAPERKREQQKKEQDTNIVEENRIREAFELYRKGDTPQLLKQPDEVRIPVLRKALRDDSLRTKAVRLISCGRFDVKELALDVISVAEESNGHLRWQAVNIIAERMPDRRAVPVLIEHCLADEYEDHQHWVDEHGGHEAMKSTAYEAAYALHVITGGEVGVDTPLHRRNHPLAAVLEMKSRGVIDQAKKWWKQNKDEFLNELKKESQGK